MEKSQRRHGREHCLRLSNDETYHYEASILLHKDTYIHGLEHGTQESTYGNEEIPNSYKELMEQD